LCLRLFALRLTRDAFWQVRQFLRELDVRHAWGVEGLLRVSAPTYAVRALWAFIGSSDFSLVRVDNVHVITSAMKLYLREQRQPVLYRALFPQLAASMRSANVAEQQSGLRYVVSLLDPLRRLVLRDLCAACARILLYSASNRMDRDNVSVCLAPSVIESDSSDPMEVAQTAPLTKAAFSLLLADSTFFFDPAQLARDEETHGQLDASDIGGGAAFRWVRLAEDEWAALLGSASLATFRNGENVCREDAKGSLVFRIHSGSCRASRHGRRAAADLAALDVFGTELSMGARSYRATVVASSTTRVYQLPVASLQNAFVIDASLAFKWYCTAAVALALQRSHLLTLAGSAAPDDETSASAAIPSAAAAWSAREEHHSPAGTPTSADRKHSSTASFALKRYGAKWHSPERKKPVAGVLAVTCTHLSFERSGGKPGAFFVAFAATTRVSVTEGRRMHVVHATELVFELEDEAAARELKEALVRVLGKQHEQRLAIERGTDESQSVAPLLALCTRPYRGENFHLQLKECDVVTLIKDDPKEELWYGECGGREGYFGRDAVVLMPERIPEAQRLSPSQHQVLAGLSQRLEFGHSELVCRENDLSCVGFLYFVLEGVCVQAAAGGEPLYLAKDDVFGELGVLLGSPLAEPVTVFSERAVLLQLDCRHGSPLSALFESDVALAGDVFRFVATVCAARVEQLQERLRRQSLSRLVIRERVAPAPSGGRKVEFDDTLVVLSDSDAGASSGSESGAKVKPRRRSHAKKDTGKAGRRGSVPAQPASPGPGLTLQLPKSGDSGQVFSMLTAKRGDEPAEEEREK
jgi:CRP-like cAMP-binding protein